MQITVNHDDDMIDRDSVVERNRFSRFCFLLFNMAPRIGIPTVLVGVLLQVLSALFEFNAPGFLGYGIGALIGLIFVGKVLEDYTFIVPGVQGLVSTDSKAKELVVYGAGLHSRFPWEVVSEKSNVSLGQLTFNVTDATVASKDAGMKYSLQFKFKPSLRRLATYIGVSQETIVKSFRVDFEEMMSADVGKMNGDLARSAIDCLTQKLRAAFGLTPDPLPDTATKRAFEAACGSISAAANTLAARRQHLEQTLGGILLDVTVNDIDFSEKVLAAREAAAQADRVPATVAKLYGLTLNNPDGTPNPTAVAKFEKLTQMDGYGAIVSKAMVVMGLSTEANINIQGDGPAVISAAIAKWLKDVHKK